MCLGQKRVRDKRLFFSAYPFDIPQNPAIKLFHKALINNGLIHEQVNFGITALCVNKGNGKLLIIHWPSFFWFSEYFVVSISKLLKFVITCYVARLNGYKLIWCAHNTMPHKINSYIVESNSRKFILKKFDLIVNLSKNASQERLNFFGFPPKNEVLAVHGHYENTYIPKGQYTRKSLGISEESILIFLHSNMKEYNGDKEFVEAFRLFNNKNITLLIVGSYTNDSNEDLNILHVPGFISNESMADLIQMSDFFALPYKKITTSGAFMLAVTFCKPIISTNLPFFKMHSLPGTQLFYEADDHDSLLRVFKDIIDGWLPNLENILLLKKAYTWDKAAKEVIKVIDNI